MQRSPSLLEAVEVKAKQRFVDRTAELAQLAGTLKAPQSQPSVICVYGSAGVGKTGLALMFRLSAERRGHRVVWLPCVQMEPNPAGFLDACASLSLPSGLRELGRTESRDVLIIDALEHIAEMTEWILNDQLLGAGANLTVVLTTRQPLDAKVTTSFALGPFVEVIELGLLEREHSEDLLRRRGLSDNEVKTAADAASGHALALAMLADSATLREELSEAERLPKTLVSAVAKEHFRDVEDPTRQDAINALAMVLRLDRSMLSAILRDSRLAANHYEWLRDRPYVTESEFGLVPHDLVRDALFDHFVQTDPERHNELSQRAIFHLVQQMMPLPLAKQRDLAIAGLYTRRNQATAKESLGLNFTRRSYLTHAESEDVRPAVALIRERENAAAAATFQQLFDDGDTITVLARNAQERLGLIMHHRLNAKSNELSEDAPSQRLHELRDRFGGPEDVVASRFYFSMKTYQDLGAGTGAMMLTGPQITGAWQPIPRYSLIVTLNPERYEPFASRTFVERIEGADMVWDGRNYGFWFMDLHKIPGATNRERIQLGYPGLLLGLSGVMPDPSKMPPPPSAMGSAEDAPQLDLAEAVRDAFKWLHNPARLAQSELLTLELPLATQDAEGLRKFLRAQVETFKASPSLQSFGEVLEVTYLVPRAKQRAAAIDLRLPWGTYRYRLRRAIESVAEQIGQLQNRS